jgi:hypothetical protein
LLKNKIYSDHYLSLNNHMASYTISIHTYNFAVWTAARAVSRNFTGTQNIIEAIKASKIWEDVTNPNIKWTQEYFDARHKEWADKIIATINDKNIDCSFGQAAKIIAVFLKTAIILPNQGEGDLAAVIHPPIDRILLKNLESAGKIGKVSAWTKFDEKAYEDVISEIKENFNPLWHVEEFWSVEEKKV